VNGRGARWEDYFPFDAGAVEFFAADAWARAAKLPFATCPPLAFAVALWTLAAAACVIGALELLEPLFFDMRNSLFSADHPARK